MTTLLPVEALASIFKWLDFKSLLSCELVCWHWRNAILEERLYSVNCELLLRQRPDLLPTFRQHNFSSFKLDSRRCKRFLSDLLKLQARWTSGVKPRVSSFHCKLRPVPEKWGRRHNYTGVYDMVWLPDSSYLVCSVYDTIQVWDMSEYKCVNVISAEDLDTVHENSTCFFVNNQNVLFTGTDLGNIRLFDVLTNEHLGTFSSPTEDGHCKQYTCDIKAYKSRLLSVDFYGRMHFWHNNNNKSLKYIQSFWPPFPDPYEHLFDQYSVRFAERLVDFNDEIMVTNGPDLFLVFDMKNGDNFLVVHTHIEVLCCKVLDRFAVWGERNGMVFRKELAKDMVKCFVNQDQLEEVYQTPYQDSITSVVVSDQRIVFGDVNAEIHCCDFKKRPLDKDSYQFMLESGHEYGSYVWAIQMDAARIFSGDSNAQLVVHDFWPYRYDVDVDEDEQVPAKKKAKQSVPAASEASSHQ